MKKLIVGIAWMSLGFLGTILILCFSAMKPWNYNGITGILGSLLGLDLIIPLVCCLLLFALGVFFCIKGMCEK